MHRLTGCYLWSSFVYLNNPSWICPYKPLLPLLSLVKMKGFSFRGLTFMFLVAFLVWSSSLEACHGRATWKNWRQNRAASAALYSKKWKTTHRHGGSHKGNHRGGASKIKPPSLLPPATKPKPDVPRSLPPPHKGGGFNGDHSSTFNVLHFGAKGNGETDDTQVNINLLLSHMKIRKIFGFSEQEAILSSPLW